MWSRRSLNFSHTQKSVPYGTLKNGCSLVTTAAGFFTGSTGTAKDLESNITSSLANLRAHLSSRFFRSSDVGLLLLDFFLLGFGDSSGHFFFPAGVVSVSLSAFSPSTHPNTLTCEGSTRVGVAVTARGGRNRLLLLFFLPSSVCGGGQLLKLFWGESSANGAVLQNTRVVTQPLVLASCTLKVVIKQSHNVATSVSLLSWGQHVDQ